MSGSGAPGRCAGGVLLYLGNFLAGSGMTIQAVIDLGARDPAQWHLWDGGRVEAMPRLVEERGQHTPPA